MNWFFVWSLWLSRRRCSWRFPRRTCVSLTWSAPLWPGPPIWASCRIPSRLRWGLHPVGCHRRFVACRVARCRALLGVWFCPNANAHVGRCVWAVEPPLLSVSRLFRREAWVAALVPGLFWEKDHFSMSHQKFRKCARFGRKE